MKPFLLFGIVALLPLAARANDSAFEGVGGSLRPMRGENKAIRMKSEVVVLTANKMDFSTRADFVFQNETGQSQTIPMGFPEGNRGDVSVKASGFKRFATFVDGNRVAAKRTTLKKMDDSGFDTYWLKTVSFAPHQTRRVRVEFRSPYGEKVVWGFSRVLSYSFTGKNWRGNVGQSKLEVRVSQPGLWRAVAVDGKGEVVPLSLQKNAQGAVFQHTWNNWDAQQNVEFGLERAIPFWRKDAGASDNDSGDVNLAAIQATQTVRVGAKPHSAEPMEGEPTDGFSRGGLLYVGLDHLLYRLEEWGQEQNPPVGENLVVSHSLSFELTAGKLLLQGSEGGRKVRVNGKLIQLSAPIVAVSDGTDHLLYVPIAPIARELGWKISLRGDRLFSLERGSWHG